jgi:hypothetical protein
MPPRREVSEDRGLPIAHANETALTLDHGEGRDRCLGVVTRITYSGKRCGPATSRPG